VAVEGGMARCWLWPRELITQGYTTLEEVERVTFTGLALSQEAQAKLYNLVWDVVELNRNWAGCPYCMTSSFLEPELRSHSSQKLIGQRTPNTITSEMKTMEYTIEDSD